MGQAKERGKALRQEMLKQSSHWDFPPSPWEAAVCAEIWKKPRLVVPRASADQIAGLPMHANKCHANVRWFMEQDVSGLTCGVTGWLVQWPDFILHSVLEAGGRMMCITPGDEAEIEFIPDPKISWVEDGEVYSAVRDGQVVGIGVRAFPSFTMARNAIVRERLLAGIDPYKAIQFSDEDMKMLKRQHIERAGLVRDITAKLPGTIEQE